MCVVIPHYTTQVLHQCLGVHTAASFPSRIMHIKVDDPEYYPGHDLIVLLRAHGHRLLEHIDPLTLLVEVLDHLSVHLPVLSEVL